MRWTIAIAGTLAACSGGYKGGLESTGTAVDKPNSDGGTTTDPTDVDTGSATDTLVPNWLDLEGDLVLVGNVPELVGSEFRLAGRDADLAQLCTVAGPPTALTEVAPPPSALLTWWDVELPADPLCLLPSTLRLGIGPYDALLDPAVAAADITGTPYGLYTESPEGELWIFGVAGGPANFAGLEDPVDVPPVPDALYRLEGLVLLPL